MVDLLSRLSQILDQGGQFENFEVCRDFTVAGFRILLLYGQCNQHTNLKDVILGVPPGILAGNPILIHKEDMERLEGMFSNQGSL